MTRASLQLLCVPAEYGGAHGHQPMDPALAQHMARGTGRVARQRCVERTGEVVLVGQTEAGMDKAHTSVVVDMA